MTTLSRHGRRRRLRVGDALLGVLAVAAIVVALPVARSVPPPVGATHTADTGTISVTVGANVPDAVNTADDGKFVQLAPAATVTLAFPAGIYAAPGTGADITVHTYDEFFRADATVQVYVKSNTNAWVPLGMIRDDDGDVGLNLEGVGLVNEVKLVQDGAIDPAYPTLGFDLDAVTATNYVTLTETCDTVTSGDFGPSWTYLSKQFVSAVGPGTATPIVTFGPLTQGVGYRFEGKGLYSAGPATGDAGTEILADARYSQRIVGQPAPADLVFGYEGFGPTLLDLLLDNGAANWQGDVFNANHAYTADRVGNGVPAEFDFQVSELYADNNIGGICVSLYKDGMGPMTTGVAVSPSMVKVGSTVAITATIDDTGKGDSWIQAAEWKVTGGPGPFAMTPVTTLDSKVEAFTASFASVPAGVHEICVRGQDKAGNWGDWSCVTLKVYDRYAKISGVIAGRKLEWKDTGEPDWAFDGMIYAAGPTQVWGSISVNYKLLNQTCTYTADGSTLIAASLAGPARVDVSELLNSCDGKRYTFQLLNRGGFGTPRGGVFISEEPGDYIQSTPYELFGAAGPLDWYVPLDRGNVILWNAV